MKPLSLSKQLGFAACLYVMSYWTLSINGRYEVYFASAYVDSAWEPLGFIRMPLLALPYYPLYAADRAWWHRKISVPASPAPVPVSAPR